MANKWHYDVKNCYYCVGTRNDDGTITFSGTPVREPGLMSMDLAPQGEVGKIRADSIDYIIFASNNGYDGDLNFVKISDHFRQDVLNEQIDETTGIQYEDADADPVPIALMGEFKGDEENIRWIFYNCAASRPNIAGDNKEKQKEPDTEKLHVQASPLPVTIGNQEVNVVRGGITPTMNSATYNAWFSQVVIPGTAVQAQQAQQAQQTPAEP